MGIKTVAVYSDFDKYSLFAKLADEAHRIGESASSKSYLLADKIIEIAKSSDAEAIHPGYGFLSERSFFAKMCVENGIQFIGPDHNAIELLGNKTAAKLLAIKNNVPVVPGTEKPLKNLNEIKKTAQEIGYPILIKASAGGGGKGMRIVKEEKDIESSLRMAQNEARASFGDDSVFIEKFIESPRHIEFQMLADKFNNVIHLGERECSMQRRLQKIIEESPSVIMTDKLRAAMGESATRIIREAGYSNAGTVEFILDKNNNYYFLEVNTRLQVEHPVTEMRTGIDLVKEQLRIASGERLSFDQQDVKFSGHAIECRIYAEDPEDNFMPSTGRIIYLKSYLGNGLREDTGIEQGDEISVYYDPMISKLIAFGADRKSAIEKMKRALKDYKIVGIKSNISFLFKLIESREFVNGNYNTQFIENEFMNRSFVNNFDENVLAVSIGAAIFKEVKKRKTNVISNSNSHNKNLWVNKRKENYR